MAKLSIGEFLSVLRKGQGFTQEEIADKLGVSAKTVSSWENDRTYPDIMMLPIIADLYGISVDELVRGERGNGKEVSNNDIQVSDKSLLKIRKMKYAKYKEKKMIFTIASIASSLFTVLGLYLMTFKASWTMVFAILGFLGFATLFVFTILNEKEFLRNEGILLKEDINEDKYPLVLSLRMNTIHTLLLSIIPYFVYGFICLLIYAIDQKAYEFVISTSVSSIEVDYTNQAMTIAILCIIFSFITFVIGLIFGFKANKEYGNDIQKGKNKKNFKLVLILILVLPATMFTFRILSAFHDLVFGDTVIESVVMETYDTYEEFVTKLNTYEVRNNELVYAGLNMGDTFELNVSNNSKKSQGSFKSGITDVGHGFVVTNNVYIERYSARLVDTSIEYDSYSYYEDELYALMPIEGKELYIKTYEGDKLTLDSSMFKTDYYNSTYECYYYGLVPGRYHLENSYDLIIKATYNTEYYSGLYYRKSADAPIDEWVYCWDADITTHWIFVDDELEHYAISNLSNKYELHGIDYKPELRDEYLGIKTSKGYSCGYIAVNCSAKGKYGEVYTAYYRSSLIIQRCIAPTLIIEVIANIAIGAILWKKDKYEFDFVKQNDKEGN